MNEDHEVKISQLLDELLARLDFEVKSQQPMHLPAITNSVILVNDWKNGSLKSNEKHIMEVTLLKNINQQVKGFNQGGDPNGSNESRK